jgi:hypothetical protein
MNDFVYFKPTKLGIKMYLHHYMKQKLPNGMELPKLKVDEDGFSRLQFHEFVRIYGNSVSTYFSPREPIFEDYNIYFKE